MFTGARPAGEDISTGRQRRRPASASPQKDSKKTARRQQEDSIKTASKQHQNRDDARSTDGRDRRLRSTSNAAGSRPRFVLKPVLRRG
ncbi:hypothetical protein TESG_08331 [Trichophyton tonsurans CBS 112818]|uniref:Uncharacterized protein n=1 Tax=Trichophyton tonsurans (strain CBS 112818) TaxID=647933 RepID=F2RT72_TRIT1|nr:hypothetical protein TESG_08331 [Trichophyton tonsurans CBS 112818]